MNKLISRVCIGVTALLFASSGMAATVTLVLGGTAHAGTIADPVPTSPATTFTLTLHGDQMPLNGGASLGLIWDATRVSATGIVLKAPTPISGVPQPGGSPFDTLAAASPFHAMTFANTSTPNECTSGPCNFDAVVITFTTILNALPGDAGIQLQGTQSSGAAFCWGDPDSFDCSTTQIAYTDPHIFVGAVPVPAAAWLFGSALGLLGMARRRSV